jgi:hypothetical protein
MLVRGSALAATHYVDVSSTNATLPYTNWATAATNIQDAVDAAVAGDEVVVTNGNYVGGINISKPLTVRSVSGPQFTTIAGGGPCVSLATNAVGFTLQSTTNLVPPAVWSTNSPAPVIIGGQNTVTNPVAGAQKFYRLVR